MNQDLISRQAAIDSVCEVCENCEYFYNEKLIQTIKDLPSVQPLDAQVSYYRGELDAVTKCIAIVKRMQEGK